MGMYIKRLAPMRNVLERPVTVAGNYGTHFGVRYSPGLNEILDRREPAQVTTGFREPVQTVEHISKIPVKDQPYIHRGSFSPEAGYSRTDDSLFDLFEPLQCCPPDRVFLAVFHCYPESLVSSPLLDE